jgi:hypothetical protein
MLGTLTRLGEVARHGLIGSELANALIMHHANFTLSPNHKHAPFDFCATPRWLRGVLVLGGLVVTACAPTPVTTDPFAQHCSRVVQR